ncbi:hypothetical protein NPIL_180921 [Nephila pilipes]|uniref:Uncharacterized protein n=1 Tax=Nephila pilipes TaxID=299642 RepID=A0A8X6N307_NEPPI|nr:hypothetical protein NPIL_180921 [Nephila pilipes]
MTFRKGKLFSLTPHHFEFKNRALCGLRSDCDVEMLSIRERSWGPFGGSCPTSWLDTFQKRGCETKCRWVFRYHYTSLLEIFPNGSQTVDKSTLFRHE